MLRAQPFLARTVTALHVPDSHVHVVSSRLCVPDSPHTGEGFPCASTKSPQLLQVPASGGAQVVPSVVRVQGCSSCVLDGTQVPVLQAKSVSVRDREPSVAQTSAKPRHALHGPASGAPQASPSGRSSS